MIIPLHTTFAGVLQWVSQNGYPFIFVGMVIEGPIIIAASSFAASLGYLNIFIIGLLAIAGDVVGDILWYGLGYFGRITIINRFGHRFFLPQERMEKLRTFLERHPIKALLAIKLSPLLPVPGLIIAGSSHLPLKKFFTTISIIIIPKTLLFMIIGYFFGSAYDSFSSYLNDGISALGILFGILLVLYYGFRKISEKLSSTLQNDQNNHFSR